MNEEIFTAIREKIEKTRRRTSDGTMVGELFSDTIAKSIAEAVPEKKEFKPEKDDDMIDEYITGEVRQIYIDEWNACIDKFLFNLQGKK